MKPKLHVRMIGQGINEEFNAIDHEIKGFSGGTYHVFTVIGPDGKGTRTLYYNDFGIRLVQIDRI